MNSDKKIALITGGAAGIGRTIALELAPDYDLVMVDVNSQGLAETAGLVSGKGGNAFTYTADVTSLAEMEKLASEVTVDHGPVTVVVNNAGITRDTLLMRMDEKAWETVLKVNLTGAFNVCKAFLKPMMKARWGRIINMTSVVGQMGNAGQANYAASKAGLIGFSKSLARELGSRNITVNCVAPGFIQTPMTDVLSDEVKDAYKAQIPLKRFGTTGDVAGVVRFLASDDAAYITGQVIRVDGGMLM